MACYCPRYRSCRIFFLFADHRRPSIPGPTAPCDMASSILASRTFRKREQIVVPRPVGIGAEILTIGAVHDTDVAPVVPNVGVECIGLRFDRIDDLLARPMPGRAAEVGDPFIRVVARLLVDARHLYVCHELFLSKCAEEALSLRRPACEISGPEHDLLSRRTALRPARGGAAASRRG